MRFLNTCIIILLALLPLTSWSAEVTKVKGQAVLIDLKGDTVAAGDTFFLVNGEGKKKALITINKVKGEKAIGKITKGRADVGMTLKGKAEKSAAADTQSEPSGKSSHSNGKLARAYWGVLLGFAMDSLSVDLKDANNTSRASVDLTGNAFSGKLLMDYRMFKQIWFRGSAGLESLNVGGASKCGFSPYTGACTVNVYYLSFDGIGRYMFNETSSIRPWAGAGFELMFPASKKSTAVDKSSIGTTSVMVVAGGFDWAMQSGTYFPVSLEYGMLPSSDEVKGHWIAMRAGVAFPW